MLAFETVTLVLLLLIIVTDCAEVEPMAMLPKASEVGLNRSGRYGIRWVRDKGLMPEVVFVSLEPTADVCSRDVVFFSTSEDDCPEPQPAVRITATTTDKRTLRTRP